MRIETLGYLVDIAQTQSLNISARRLFISQPSLSKAIKSLENELNIQLIERSHQGVVLTEAGHKVVARAQNILKEVNLLNDELVVCRRLARDKEAVPTLNLSINNQIPYIINPIFQAFYLQNPATQLTVEAKTVLGVLQDIQSGHADIGFLGYWPAVLEIDQQMANIARNLIIEGLYTEPVYVVSHRSLGLDILAAGQPLTPRQLLPYPLVLSKGQKLIDRFFGGVGVPNAIMQTQSSDMTRQSILNALAYSFFSQQAINSAFTADQQQELTILPVEPEMHIFYALVYDNEARNHPSSQHFMTAVRDYFSQSPF